MDARYTALVHSLVARRKAKRLSQADLATRLGKPQSFVSKVETLKRELRVMEHVDWDTALSDR